MPVIKIHCSPLTFKMLHTRYKAQGEEPYLIEHQDPYFYHFCYNSLKDDPKRTKAEYNLLTHSIDFEVGNLLYRHLNNKFRNVRVGLYLHRIHKQKINEFIEAGQFYGDERWNALKRFFDLNDITEDDYSIPSAYKSWQRHQDWLKKNTRKKFFNRTHGVPKKRTKVKLLNSRKPVPYRKVLRAVNSYFDCGLVNIMYKPIVIKRNKKKFYYAFEKNIARKHVYERSILFYLLSRWSLLSTAQIYNIVGRLSTRSIQKNISAIKAQRKIYDHIDFDIEKIKKLL